MRIKDTGKIQTQDTLELQSELVVLRVETQAGEEIEQRTTLIQRLRQQRCLRHCRRAFQPVVQELGRGQSELRMWLFGRDRRVDRESEQL